MGIKILHNQTNDFHQEPMIIKPTDRTDSTAGRPVTPPRPSTPCQPIKIQEEATAAMPHHRTSRFQHRCSSAVTTYVSLGCTAVHAQDSSSSRVYAWTSGAYTQRPWCI